MRSVEISIDLNFSPQEVLEAFVVQEHLNAWWGVNRSLIELKRGGLYSLVWQDTELCVDYVSSGIIAEYLPACQLKVDKMIYVNPKRAILGPMELLVLATPEGNDLTRLTVIQSGYQTGADWDWLYEAVQKAWPEVLKKLKTYLETQCV
jgi:hypothetical protein